MAAAWRRNHHQPWRHGASAANGRIVQLSINVIGVAALAISQRLSWLKMNGNRRNNQCINIAAISIVMAMKISGGKQWWKQKNENNMRGGSMAKSLAHVNSGESISSNAPRRQPVAAA